MVPSGGRVLDVQYVLPLNEASLKINAITTVQMAWIMSRQRACMFAASQNNTIHKSQVPPQ